MIWVYFGVLIMVILALGPHITRWIGPSTEELIRGRERWLTEFMTDHTLTTPPSRPQPKGDENGNP